jgi:hypothetical protein
MPGSLTTPGGIALALTRLPLLPSTLSSASAPDWKRLFAAQWLAYAFPYRRFASLLTETGARLGGRCGSLLLHRGGLSPLTPCRFVRRI